VPFITRAGSFNFLEPSGAVQACNGTALPLPYCTKYLNIHTYAEVHFTRFMAAIVYMDFEEKLALWELQCYLQGAICSASR